MSLYASYWKCDTEFCTADVGFAAFGWSKINCDGLRKWNADTIARVWTSSLQTRVYIPSACSDKGTAPGFQVTRHIRVHDMPQLCSNTSRQFGQTRQNCGYDSSSHMEYAVTLHSATVTISLVYSWIVCFLLYHGTLVRGFWLMVYTLEIIIPHSVLKTPHYLAHFYSSIYT